MPLDKILTPEKAKELIEKGKASKINYNNVTELLFIGKELYSKEKGKENYELVRRNWFSYLKDVQRSGLIID